MDQNGMSISHRGPSIDASYHVSVHFAMLFQSRKFLEIDQSEIRIETWQEASIESPLFMIAHFVQIH
jgi:hypothetical protein